MWGHPWRPYFYEDQRLDAWANSLQPLLFWPSRYNEHGGLEEHQGQIKRNESKRPYNWTMIFMIQTNDKAKIYYLPGTNVWIQGTLWLTCFFIWFFNISSLRNTFKHTEHLACEASNSAISSGVTSAWVWTKCWYRDLNWENTRLHLLHFKDFLAALLLPVKCLSMWVRYIFYQKKYKISGPFRFRITTKYLLVFMYLSHEMFSTPWLLTSIPRLHFNFYWLQAWHLMCICSMVTMSAQMKELT